MQRTQFELLPLAEAARVHPALALLQPGMLAGYLQNTMVLLRVGLKELAAEAFAEARLRSTRHP